MALVEFDEGSTLTLPDRYYMLTYKWNTLKSWVKVFQKLVPYRALNTAEEDVDLLEEWKFEVQTIESKLVDYPPIGRNGMMLKIKRLASLVRRYQKIRITYKNLHKRMCDRLRQKHGEEGFAQLKAKNAYLNLLEMEMEDPMESLETDDEF